VLHVALVVFVVGGLVARARRQRRRLAWVNRRAFRFAHAAAIAVVAAEAWLGLTCPLTTLEMALRERAGAATYGGGFVEHWLQRLLYWDAPAWVFVALYTVFAVLVAATWWYFPPTTSRRPAGPGGT
jgi:polyferredoxin